MSITVKQAIDNSLLILVESTDYSAAPDDSYGRSLPLLISHMAILQEAGLDIFTGPVENITLTSALPVIPSAWNFIFMDFAIRLASYFDASPQVTMALIAKSRDDAQTLWAMYGPNIAQKFPSNLPVGMANEWLGGYGDYHYFPDCDPRIYPENCSDRSVEGAKENSRTFNTCCDDDCC